MSKENHDLTNARDVVTAELIKKDCMHDDYEVAHIQADEILCRLLKTLGYFKTVEAFNSVGKWYA